MPGWWGGEQHLSERIHGRGVSVPRYGAAGRCHLSRPPPADQRGQDADTVRIRRQTQGQAMLEFALIFPLILLLILMFIELGRVVYYYSALNNAVREGARYAIVRPFPSSGQRLADTRQRARGY